MLCDRLGVSERWACQVTGQHRSTQRYELKTAEDDAALRAALRKISEDKPRWGYRRAHARLIEEGWSVNKKRVQRLWRDEGLRVPRRKRKRARLGDNRDAKRLRAERPDHVWALDFQTDETADGRQIRVLNVVDEFTREALASEVARSITAEDTVALLERLVAERGTAPEHIRCDNGSALTAASLKGRGSASACLGLSSSGGRCARRRSPYRRARASMPRKRRPSSTAAAPVVPEPAVGSSTRPSGGQNSRTSQRISSSGFTVG